MLKTADMLDAINRRLASVLRWFAIFMVLIQFGIVIGRYVFGVNSIWVQESVLYLHAALFMLAAGYTLQVDKHVRVDIFYAKASPTTRRRIDIAGHLFLLLPSVAVLAWWSWPSVRNSWKILEGPISVGGIEAVFLLKSLIPAFCALVALQSLAILLRLFAGEGEE
ncbi:TRAP transporter small permease subunit [Aliiruegeria lutimaris]|uniref:TRAP transporter small permease protein n=1 Tax=Aliiruegeria lutimaris TaxID=571298 RepID=A0A1G9K258_9RHOB|nr:TRAP transporter small permease subunit [Aliiruegeria lutimaris]SDL43566.1 TRAP-type mannitol/chloroaromatic compound transport system, small permease component [Aliiruegeria lutimaris]